MMRPTDPIQSSRVGDFPTAAFAACDLSFDISQAIAFPYDDPRQLHPVPSRRKDYGGDPAAWDGATSGWKALFIARSKDPVVGYAMMSEYWHGLAALAETPGDRRGAGRGGGAPVLERESGGWGQGVAVA